VAAYYSRIDSNQSIALLMNSAKQLTADTGENRELNRIDLVGAVLVIVCCALWGGNAVAVKLTVSHIPPIGCAGLRFLLSSVVIAVWCRLEGTSLRLAREQIGPIVWNALLLFVQMATFNWGTLHTNAGRSSVFINVHPFVVAPLAWFFIGEPMGWRSLVGLLLAGGGVALLFDPSELTSPASLAGDLSVLVSGALIGVLMIYQKQLLHRFRPNHLLFWMLVFSLPLFLGYSAWVEGFDSYEFNRESVVGLGYQSLLVSGFCFIVWMALLRRYPANQLAAFGFLTPFFGIASAWLMLSEPLAPRLIGGCALVGWGLFLVTRPAEKKEAPAN